jgi:hypothetical protein
MIVAGPKSRQEGSMAVGAIVTTWGLAILAASAAFELLWGYPRLVAVGLAVAIAMFVNDVAPVDLLFTRAKRPWVWSGLVRGITGIAGISVILVLGIQFAHGYDARIATAIIAGLLTGSIAGSLTRFVGERRAARNKRSAE